MRLALCLATATTAAPAAAVELVHRGGWDMVQPVSLAYDARMCGLWVVQERPEAVLVTLTGVEIARFDTGFARARAVTVDGDTVIAGDGLGNFRRFTRDGRPQGDPVTLIGDMHDIEGIHRDPLGGHYLVGDDPALVVRLDAAGAEDWRLPGETLEPPLLEPQGIGRDPISGNVLVVDDNEGRNALFEFAPGGALLSVTSLAPWGRDAEGVAVQPQTGRLFIAYDWSGRVEAFDWAPSQRSLAAPLDPGPACPIG